MTKYWIVGTENGTLLEEGTDLTTQLEKAKHFPKIGDAMKECVRLNEANFGIGTFKVIPMR